MINIYSVYRLTLLAVAVYSLVNIIISIVKYKQYYHKIPKTWTNKLVRKGGQIISKQLQQQRQGIAINIALLLILIGLNILMFKL